MSEENKIIAKIEAEIEVSDFVKELPDHRKTIVVVTEPK
jgi:hypothetical protein